MSQQLEVVANENNKCGEGPVWDHRINRLVWVDLSSSLVFEFEPSTRQTSVLCREPQASGIALNGADGYVLAGAAGIHLWQRGDTYRTLATRFEGEELSFNDIIAGPGGCIYAGTIYWGADGMIKPGKLLRFDPGGGISVQDEGIEMANGLAFSPDDQTLYLADSARRLIYAYDVDSAGQLSNRRVFVTVPGEEGLPDGHTVDAEGHLWSAQWYGSQVVRYDPEGRVERRIAVPAKQVASLAFGGDDMADLYITTAGESEVMSNLIPPGYDEIGNIGGALYRCRPGVQGRREHIANLS